MVRPLYNGNIAETTWRTASDNIRRRYGYTYDYLNRLRDAWYQVPGTTMPVSNAYNEHLTYDSNGNIMTLFRNGEVDDPDNVQEIDDMEYEYDDGNKLLNVIDYTAHSAGFNDGNTGNDPDFEYDSYGNLIKDRNKEIDEIVYNHLNLPKKIIFENENTIEYLYDANGIKLRKIVTDNTTSPATMITTHYLDGFQYSEDKMDFFPTAEGYVKATHSSGGGIGVGTTTYNYVFNYTDHLGNIRLRYAINPVNQWLEILEEDHYYPFGLKHQGYNAENYVFATLGGGPVQLIPTNLDALETYKFKFQGQELEEEFGKNTYAYQWRDYDPAIARFNKMDRFSEKYFDQSPYHFTRNNPIYFVEIAGDSLNVAQFRDYDKKANENLINDLQDKTGLSLETDEDGNVTYASENGKPVIARNDKGKKQGSRAARKALMKLINSDKKVSVGGTDGLTRVDMDGNDPNLILINPNQIENFISNTSKDLNPTTFGYALNFFHEIGHTEYGGAGQDPPFVIGQNAYEQAGRQESLPNRIRRQLGKNYGQRSSYNPYFIKSEGKSYFPWSQTTLSRLKNNQTPTTKYISVPIGN